MRHGLLGSLDDILTSMVLKVDGLGALARQTLYSSVWCQPKPATAWALCELPPDANGPICVVSISVSASQIPVTQGVTEKEEAR